MLEINPKKRITALQALEHDWIKQNDNRQSLLLQMTNSEQTRYDGEIFKRIQSFQGQSQLKKAAVNIFVKHLDTSHIQKLHDEF